jgi:formate dehydrogenase subunit delta
MNATPPERLIYMANQVAKFFDSQTGDPAQAVAAHLRTFWAPTMRSEIIEVFNRGDEGLDPTTARAVALLAAASGVGRTDASR